MKLINMNALSRQEQRIAQDLIDTGFAHAAQSFSSLVEQEVSFEKVCLGISEIGIINPIYYSSGNMTLVLTDVLGAVGGRSYLLFSEEEGEVVQKLCLPSANDHQRTAMGEAVLKEIDNILSAAMITKISEALNVHVYGGVPELVTLPASSMQQKIREDFLRVNGRSHLIASVRFLLSESPGVQPQFLWKLPPDFLHYLEEYIRSVDVRST